MPCVYCLDFKVIVPPQVELALGVITRWSQSDVPPLKFNARKSLLTNLADVVLTPDWLVVEIKPESITVPPVTVVPSTEYSIGVPLKLFQVGVPPRLFSPRYPLVNTNSQ